MNDFDGLELPPRAGRTSLGSESLPDEAPSTNSADNKAAREIKKRNRIPVSCNECRRRKLRCDRKDPCAACVQRGDADGCKFTEPLSSQQKSRSAKPGSRDFLQQRIHRLESLVTDLAAQVRHSNSPPSNTDSASQSPELIADQSDSSRTPPSHTADEVKTEPIDDLKIAMGDMKISNGKMMYIGGNSWNTILDEIADIKYALSPVYSSYHVPSTNTAPLRPSSFPFFAAQTPSISDLLALFPSRADTEMLVQKFLTNMLTMCPCLQRHLFLKNLSDFYAAPDSADPIFLGTLFAMLACGISIYADDGATRNILTQKGVKTRKEMATIWRDASMQAFCLGGFLTNTSLENMQGLIVLFSFLTSFQMTYNLGWPLFGMIVSIALNMGLHRDGSLFNLDPYETEVRRRIWSILIMIDGLNAASYGRPMMIADTQFDTKPLASINDCDFNPGQPIVPPKNPEQITDTTYTVCKLALTMMLRKIISSLFGIKPPSYDTILEMDKEIRELYDSFPTDIKYAAPAIGRGVDLTLAVQRLGCKTIMSHALVILHRPFLHRSFRNPRYVPSREKCMDAAHTVLELFHEYRNNQDYVEYSWYGIGALHAFHAGTVVGLRCYLEPLSCDQRDWIALDKVRQEFEKISHFDGWKKLGEKGSKVFGILIKKALEKKAVLEGSLGGNAAHIGGGSAPQNGVSTPATVQSQSHSQSFSSQPSSATGFDSGLSFSTPGADTSISGSTGWTPQYTGPLFPNQYDPNPLTNPALHSEVYNGSILQGAGMPGLVSTDSSPDQTNWDAFWPKGMNLSEWDIFFDNMDVDFSGSNNTALSGQTGLSFDGLNAFPATGGNVNGSWDFNNSTFGNGNGNGVL